MSLIILVVLALLVVGVFPRWEHSQSWGYGPTGVAGFLLLVFVLLWLSGRL